jgi:anthranilate/para-aminobenzoate synthase component I
VVATSPELFLGQAVEKADRLLWTSPIKGTRPRSTDPAADAALARELEEDPKEVAELTMIIDVERNDLGRLAIPGTVRLVRPPCVESHASVHHRVATIEARLAASVGRAELLRAMLPSGSVTGAPKVRAMEIIAELEAERRGLYTGAFGFLKHDGTLELGMAIRTLSIQGSRGEYFTGGGIVADSVPEREVEETLWKAADYLSLT